MVWRSRLTRLRSIWSSRYRGVMQWQPATRSPGLSSPGGAGPSNGREPPLVALTAPSRAAPAARPPDSALAPRAPIVDGGVDDVDPRRDGPLDGGLVQRVGRVVIMAQVGPDTE